MSQPKRVAFQKFINAMRKLSIEVNDTEICKRLEILMATSKDDLPIAQINLLMADPKNFDPKSISEPFTQYVRHFIYMAKRNRKYPTDLTTDPHSGSPTNAHPTESSASPPRKLNLAKKSPVFTPQKSSSKKTTKKKG